MPSQTQAQPGRRNLNREEDGASQVWGRVSGEACEQSRSAQAFHEGQSENADTPAAATGQAWNFQMPNELGIATSLLGSSD